MVVKPLRFVVQDSNFYIFYHSLGFLPIFYEQIVFYVLFYGGEIINMQIINLDVILPRHSL